MDSGLVAFRSSLLNVKFHSFLVRCTDLNKLVTDQQAQIKKLNDQIQTDTAAALQMKSDDANTALQAKKTGLEQGAGIGVGATFVLLVLIFGIKRFTTNFTVTKKPLAKAASV